MNVLNAAAFFPEWDGHEDAYDRDDRVYDQTLYGIPSQPVIRRTKKGPKLLIGGGGGIISIDPKIGLKRHRSYWKEL